MDNDKEKSIVEKMVDKINDVVENLTVTASNAAQDAMESDVRKMEPTPKASAGTSTGQLYVAPPDPGLAAVRQQYMEDVAATAAAPKKPAKQPSAKTAKKTVKKAAKKAAKKSSRKDSKKTSKKTAKKTSKKTAGKTKSTARRTAVGKKKTIKKVAKKTKAKKPKR